MEFASPARWETEGRDHPKRWAFASRRTLAPMRAPPTNLWAPLLFLFRLLAVLAYPGGEEGIGIETPGVAGKPAGEWLCAWLSGTSPLSSWKNFGNYAAEPRHRAQRLLEHLRAFEHWQHLHPLRQRVALAHRRDHKRALRLQVFERAPESLRGLGRGGEFDFHDDGSTGVPEHKVDLGAGCGAVEMPVPALRRGRDDLLDDPALEGCAKRRVALQRLDRIDPEQRVQQS